MFTDCTGQVDVSLYQYDGKVVFFPCEIMTYQVYNYYVVQWVAMSLKMKCLRYKCETWDIEAVVFM